MDVTWRKVDKIRKSRDFRLIQRRGSKLKTRDFSLFFCLSIEFQTRSTILDLDWL